MPAVMCSDQNEPGPRVVMSGLARAPAKRGKTAAVATAPRKPAPALERTTVQNLAARRVLLAPGAGRPDRASGARLAAGHPERADHNAIDICEEKEIAPEIAVSVSTEEGTITIAEVRYAEGRDRGRGVSRPG